MVTSSNKYLNDWIDDIAARAKPDKIVWIDGSEAQINELRELAVSTGSMIRLNEEKLPNCFLHRTDPNDVARVEGRTYICCKNEEDAGPTNHWMEPAKMYEKLYGLLEGSMKGRTMYVIPYSMSVVGSPFAKYGIELTDSTYVVLNMAIMTRVGEKVLEAIGDRTDFIRGVHTQGTLDPEEKYIVHFPEDNVIFSVNSNYGGNVLQGKKCFALRMASNQGRKEGWMAEHMLILGVENPKGEVRYVCGAFPSACGKTNLAMLIPPEGYRKNGWKTWCVGDDIAWLRPGEDGRLWAVNPENGFFGVAPGTSMKSNPNALESTREGTIFTNVALDTSDNTVWWEGMNKTPPAHAIDWLPTVLIRRHIPTLALPPPRETAPASLPNLKIPRAFPSPQSSLADAEQRQLLWFISPATGSMVFSSALSWLPKPPPPRQVRSVLYAETRWLCCLSAATTWLITGSTGSIWSRRLQIPPRFST